MCWIGHFSLKQKRIIWIGTTSGRGANAWSTRALYCAWTTFAHITWKWISQSHLKGTMMLFLLYLKESLTISSVDTASTHKITRDWCTAWWLSRVTWKDSGNFIRYINAMPSGWWRVGSRTIGWRMWGWRDERWRLRVESLELRDERGKVKV